MKTLILVRHAHAAQGEDDFERPLTERGQQQAELVGGDLKELGLVPDTILCSTALRARRTAEIVAAVLSFAGEVVKNDRLYEASMLDYLEAIRAVPETVHTLLLVGHNPSVSELLCAIHGGRIELPPAGYDILRRNHWADFKP